MKVHFYGLDEVCIVGAIDNSDSTTAPKSERVSPGQGRVAAPPQIISIPQLSAASSPTAHTPDNSKPVAVKGLVKADVSPVEMELQILRSRLEIATSLLADRDETIENLFSELTTFKSLYKESILEMNSAKPSCKSSSPVTPDRDESPHRKIGRSRTMMQLRLTWPSNTTTTTNTNDGGGASGAERRASAAAQVSPSLSPQSSVPLPIVFSSELAQRNLGTPSPGARLSRSYSWRAGLKRSISNSMQQQQGPPSPPPQPPPQRRWSQ